MAEAVVTLSLLALFLAISLPALGGLLCRRALDAAAARLAGAMAKTRQEAIARGRYAGLVFSRARSGDWYAIHIDGGRRGIRTSEVASGVDARIHGPIPVGISQDGVKLGIPLQPAIRCVPPSTGILPPGGDPIRLGSSDILSFSPIGESTSGSVYLTDGRGGLRAVVVYGRSGRIRVWEWTPNMSWRRQ